MIHGRKDNDLREDSRRKCRVLGVWRGELRNGNGWSWINNKNSWRRIIVWESKDHVSEDVRLMQQR